MLFGPRSLGIAFCCRPRVIYQTVSARGLLPYLRSYFSSSNYTLLKRWKNLKSPLKGDRFSLFLPIVAICFLYLQLSFYVSVSLHLAHFRLCPVASPEISSLPAGSLFFSSSVSSSILLRSLPISVSTEIARHLGKQGSKQASKQSISNEGFSRYFFFRHSNCFQLPPVFCFLFPFLLLLYVTIAVICITIVQCKRLRLVISFFYFIA